MTVERGRVVVSLNGRDKGRLLLVLNADEKYCTLCDGKRRTVACLKRKKISHVKPTQWMAELEIFATDKSVRRFLNSLQSDVAR